jgi:hypothetical protein
MRLLRISLHPEGDGCLVRLAAMALALSAEKIGNRVTAVSVLSAPLADIDAIGLKPFMDLCWRTKTGT